VDFPARQPLRTIGGAGPNGPLHSRQAAFPRLDFGYHHYTEMTDWLGNVTAFFPEITALYSIGKSVEGK
jgi:hypothetical protein